MRQSHDSTSEKCSHRLAPDSNEGLIIKVYKETVEDLTIHSICHASVAWNTVAEILDFEGTLEARSEESTERSDERCKCAQNHQVQLYGCNGDVFWDEGQQGVEI